MWESYFRSGLEVSFPLETATLSDVRSAFCKKGGFLRKLDVSSF